MLEGGPLDVLTGDYLADLTLLILGRDRAKDPDRGYARTLLVQTEECLGLAAERTVRIVVNAGGLAAAVRVLAGRLGFGTSVASVEGDDLLPRAPVLGLGALLTSSSPAGSPTPRWSSGPGSRTSGGPGTTSTRWPARSWPATCWSAARRPPAAASPP
jgi:hypothetical protein